MSNRGQLILAVCVVLAFSGLIRFRQWELSHEQVIESRGPSTPILDCSMNQVKVVTNELGLLGNDLSVSIAGLADTPVMAARLPTLEQYEKFGRLNPNPNFDFSVCLQWPKDWPMNVNFRIGKEPEGQRDPSTELVFTGLKRPERSVRLKSFICGFHLTLDEGSETHSAQVRRCLEQR